jgi:hypothetical protein
MKSALIFVVAISGMIGVYSSPAARGTHVDIIRTPRVPEPDVERSVNGARSPNSLAVSVSAPWTCIVVNTAKGNSGYAQGATRAEVLASAQNNCASVDCKLQQCVFEGCIAYAAGPQHFELYSAFGYGSKEADQTRAQSGALTACQAHDSTGCTIIITICASGAT